MPLCISHTYLLKLRVLFMSYVSQTIGLWCCRHVTRSGLLVLVSRCSKLKSVNVWGTRVPLDCFADLLSVNPGLEIKA